METYQNSQYEAIRYIVFLPSWMLHSDSRLDKLLNGQIGARSIFMTLYRQRTFPHYCLHIVGSTSLESHILQV